MSRPPTDPGASRVVLYELAQLGVSHAPFTRVFTQTVALALPDRRLAIFAHPSHLDAALRDLPPPLGQLLSQVAIPRLIASPLAVAKVLWLLCRTLSLRKDGNAFAVFLTSQPQHIWAAKLFRHLVPGFRCHLVLHGDVHHLQRRDSGWFRSMAQLNHRDIRFLVLEPHIAHSIARLVPGIAPYVDAIHHPSLARNGLCGDAGASDQPAAPFRFGIVGIAGRSKGLDVYARVAGRVRAQFAERVDFRLVGKVQKGWRDLDLDGISGPRPFSEEWLSREVFEAELSALHYVVLPYDMAYYAYAASGVLLDALRWRKPIVSLRVPPVQALSDRFGDVGHICDSEAEIDRTIGQIVTGFDPARYETQRRNLEAAYRSRLPEAVAGEYAAVLAAAAIAA